MPVKKDPSGHRSVESEAEVPGSPEEVWAAIATGPGISAWFVPSTCDQHVGGEVTSNFGPGMQAIAKITEWQPPEKFAAEAEDGPVGKVATEWTVESRGGGKCLVRVVHRWFASTDDWDNQFEGHTHGWQAFFRILRAYLAYFPGASSTGIQLSLFRKATPLELWRPLMESLGVTTESKTVAPTEGTPFLAGQIERMGDDVHPELLLRLNQPAPGIAHMFPMPMGGQTLLSVRFYLYGDEGAAAAPEMEQHWTSWLAERLPEGASA